VKIRVPKAMMSALLTPLILAGCQSPDSVGPYTPLVWSTVATGTNMPLYGVWGTSSSDVWAVGWKTILHFNGATWSPVTDGATWALFDVWGSSASDVWVVGQSYTTGSRSFLHYDGTGWSAFPSPSVYLPTAIWGSSTSDVWAVDEGGTIVHYDGTNWSSVWSGTQGLNAVWGTSASNVWAVGTQTILHYDGTRWSTVYDASNVVSGVWGTSRSDAWAVGSTVLLHYDGVRWSSNQGVSTLPVFALGVWASSPRNVLVVGFNGFKSACCPGGLAQFNGTTWSSIPIGTVPTLRAVWGSSASDVWIVGDSGTVLHGSPSG
jgi:hypothetical protein